MTPDKKLLWALPGGRVIVTTPCAPMFGTYWMEERGVEQAFARIAPGMDPPLPKLVRWLDGLVAVGQARFEPSETEEEYLARIAMQVRDRAAQINVDTGRPINEALANAPYTGITGAAHRAIDTDFPNALTPDGKPDMAKCREALRVRLRARRAPLLAALDVEYQRADEAGDAAAKKRIAARKQALRDVTADPAIDAAQTPADLMHVLPEALR